MGVNPNKSPPFNYLFLFLHNFLNGQGLGGSRCGSVTVRFKHHTVGFFIAAPPFATFSLARAKARRMARVDCLLEN